MDITTGKIQKAQRVVIYGPEGIGKSTLAASFPSPLFIDTEGSTDHMDVARTPKPTDWNNLCEFVDWLRTNQHDYKTLIIDTIDWAEKLCARHLCESHGKKGLEDFGFGKGYVHLYDEFYRFIERLDVIRNMGVNIVLTAHSHIKRFDLPEETGSFDRYELKLEKKTTPLIKEWADIILFCNYKTHVVDVDGKKKAQGGRRVMYTVHTPNWDAKNRHDLPEELDMDFKHISHCIPNYSTNTTAFNTELYDLMKRDGVTAQEVQALVATNSEYSADTPLDNYDETFVKERIIGAWPNFLNAIKNRRTN